MNKTLNVRELFSESPYLIPIYQRNYAWDTSEVKQLIQDTADYARNHSEWEYYIGTLIVLWNKDGKAFETIDGQQRLTTLYIILCSLKNWEEQFLDMDWFKMEQLSFDNRENSCRSLRMIYENRPVSENEAEHEEHIVSIYDTIRPTVQSICSDLDLSIKSYIDYLLSKVKILRIEVPKDIKKNHYFEVMNSRGVQLEQHEVVKANLMEKLQTSHDDMYTFGRIWDACSNMERYVQMNFYPNERQIIFGEDWTSDPLADFDEIVSRFPLDGKQCPGTPISLRTILDTIEEGKSINLTEERSGKSQDQDDDQFYSVINFQNFLLHVLKLYLPDKNIRLDDKHLSDAFLSVLGEADDKVSFVKGFAICLLRCRFLYDKYVVRRQNDRWCLKRLRSTHASTDGKLRPYYVRTFGKEDEEENSTNEETIVLLSMFHVSTPTMVYKNWLHGVLHFLYTDGAPSMPGYVVFLRKMAITFMLDRYLSPKEKMVDFMDIIYNKDCVAKNTLADVDWSLLDQGVAVENFVFNFYDYILWKEEKPDRFEFSYRNSVEHFYPQHPSNPKDVMDSVPLNKFGNLCLISSSTNSKFTNNMPEAKLANFKDVESVFSQSLKLQDMFKTVQGNRLSRPSGHTWTIDDIDVAEDKAINLLKKYLGNHQLIP